MEGVHIDTIRDVGGLAGLASEWDAVLGDSVADGPFLTHECVSEWWRQYGEGRDLSVLTCRDDSRELLGVLPLYGCRMGGAGSPRVLRLLCDEGVGAIGLGAFARAGREVAVCLAFGDHLCARVADWDALDLRFMRCDSAFFERMQVPPPGCSVSVRGDTGTSPVIALPADWDTYLSTSLDGHDRRGIGRTRRRAAEAGARWERITDPADLPQALSDANALYEERMRTVVGPFFATTPEYRRFARHVAAWLLERDRLRLWFLAVDGERAAFWAFVRHGDALHAIQTGFAEKYAALSAPKVLLGFAIEDAIREGCTKLCFGLGDQRYKHEWGAYELECFSDLRVFSGSVNGRLAAMAQQLADVSLDALLAAPDVVRKPIVRTVKAARSMTRGKRRE